MFTMPITTNKPVNFISFSIVLLVIMGICLCISPDIAYASSVDPLGYGSAHFPFEPSVSDFSGYFVLEDAHGDDVMFFYNFIPVVSLELSGLSTLPAVRLSISGSEVDITVFGGSEAIGDFALYMFSEDSIDLVAYRVSLGASIFEYVYSSPYSITGLALVGSSIVLEPGSRSYDAVSLSFGSDDPYPELLYLYYQEIQGDLYETFYPIVTGWLESIGGNTSRMQSYLQEITILLTNYLGQSTLVNGDLTLLGYTESIDASLKELLDAFENSGGTGSGSTDGLLQSLLDFLTDGSLRTAITGGIGNFFVSGTGGAIMSGIIRAGVELGVNDSDIPALLTELTDIVSELNSEYDFWSSGMNDYRYSEVNNRGKSVFQQLWYSLISPLISSDTSGSFSYYYLDEYGKPQTGHISVIRLFQELIFSDFDDGSLDFNYFNNWDSGYLP